VLSAAAQGRAQPGLASGGSGGAACSRGSAAWREAGCSELQQPSLLMRLLRQLAAGAAAAAAPCCCVTKQGLQRAGVGLPDEPLYAAGGQRGGRGIRDQGRARHTWRPACSMHWDALGAGASHAVVQAAMRMCARAQVCWAWGPAQVG
jgi:hypothetical protein